MDVSYWAILLLHTIQNLFGMIVNGILIFLVLKRTPRQLATYSILILNFAICDFVACAAAFFVQQRIISGGLGLYFVSHGPCVYFGPKVCFVGYSLMLQCYSHGLWSLLFSFSYRYYILGHQQPKRRTVILIIFLIYLPSLFQFITFSFASDGEAELRAIIKKKFGYDVSSECVSGHKNILSWIVLPFILHMTLPIAPVYTIILVLRRLTAKKLMNANAISERARRLQSQLLKALIVQACVPVFFLFAVITYALEQLNIYHHPLLEYAAFILLGCVPMLSPLTSLYFIGPYRVWITNTFTLQNKITQARLSTTLPPLYQEK